MENSFQENTFFLLMAIGILIMLALALAFVLFFSRSQKKILQEQMRNQQLAYEHQEALLHSTILTQEAERKRIARELHDEIGSKLNVIFLNMHRLRKFGKENAEIGSITGEVNILINTTIDTARRISYDLLPPTLEEFGLVEAVKELRDSYQRAGNLSIQFEHTGQDVRIDASLIELNLYRILQELINNSIKHGKARSITIKLQVNQPSVKLEYQDDGKGFDIKSLGNKKGLGMKNIESRLNMIKAAFQYESVPGKGMKLTIEL